MKETLVAYFEGEKNAGAFLAALGVVGVVVAGVFWAERWELRSFSITLGIVALVEIAIGVGLYLKTDPQVARLLSQLASDAQGFFAAERPRMEKVQRNFVVLEAVWVGLFVTMAIVSFTQRARPALWGVALALVVQSSVFFVFDSVAERRGAIYYERLRDL